MYAFSVFLALTKLRVLIYTKNIFSDIICEEKGKVDMETFMKKLAYKLETNKKIYIPLSLILIAIYIFSICPVAMQNDVFWSIEVGEKLVKEGAFRQDNFSIHDNLEYVAHHFLTDILIYLVYNLSGVFGLYILEIILTVIMTLCLYKLNKVICKNKFVSYFLLFAELVLIKPYIAVRAQMVSFIVFIIELILLEKYSESQRKKYFIGLIILPLILANFHMGVIPFYFIILGVYGFGTFAFKLGRIEGKKQFDKKCFKGLILIGVISLCIIFINPYFIDGVIYPFKTLTNDFINANIQEFQPYSMDTGYEVLTLFYIMILVVMLLSQNRKIRLMDLLLVLGTIFMTCKAIRYMSLFVICSIVLYRYLPGLQENGAFDFGERLLVEDKKVIKYTMAVFVFLLPISLFINVMTKYKLDFAPEEVYPIKATEWLKGNLKEEDRLFNIYEWGGYLMLNDIKVYIDSRCDLYTEEYNDVTIATDYERLTNCSSMYTNIIDKYDLNVFMIYAGSKLDTLLNVTPGYEVQYTDGLCKIYRKVVE